MHFYSLSVNFADSAMYVEMLVLDKEERNLVVGTGLSVLRSILHTRHPTGSKVDWQTVYMCMWFVLLPIKCLALIEISSANYMNIRWPREQIIFTNETSS